MRAYLYVFQNKWTSTVYIFIAISLLVRSGCYGLNVCAFLPLPPQFMCWSPNFQCGLWEWKLWEVIGWSHGSRSLMMDWCPYKGTNRPELSLGHVGIQQEGRCLQAREQVLTRTQSWWHSDIGLLVSRTVRYIQLFKPPSLGVLLLQPRATKTMGLLPILPVFPFLSSLPANEVLHCLHS